MIVPEKKLISLEELSYRWTGADDETLIGLVNEEETLSAYVAGKVFLDSKKKEVAREVIERQLGTEILNSVRYIRNWLWEDDTEYLFLLDDVLRLEKEHPELAKSVISTKDDHTFYVSGIARVLHKTPQQMADILNNDSVFRLVTSAEKAVKQHIESGGWQGAEDVHFFTPEDVLKVGIDALTVKIYDWLEWKEHHPELFTTQPADTSTMSTDNGTQTSQSGADDEQARRILEPESQLEDGEPCTLADVLSERVDILSNELSAANAVIGEQKQQIEKLTADLEQVRQPAIDEQATGAEDVHAFLEAYPVIGLIYKLYKEKNDWNEIVTVITDEAKLPRKHAAALLKLDIKKVIEDSSMERAITRAKKLVRKREGQEN